MLRLAWFHLRRALRPSRRRMLLDTIADLDRLSPETLKDIGLASHSIRDAAEGVVDAALERQRMADEEELARLGFHGDGAAQLPMLRLWKGCGSRDRRVR
jgi:uncharacterized protein YjiS (DUF1127 family)